MHHQDKKVDFSNEAYWEGYTPSTGVKVEEKGYSYTAGGSCNLVVIISS